MHDIDSQLMQIHVRDGKGGKEFDEIMPSIKGENRQKALGSYYKNMQLQPHL